MVARSVLGFISRLDLVMEFRHTITDLPSLAKNTLVKGDIGNGLQKKAAALKGEWGEGGESNFILECLLHT